MIIILDLFGQLLTLNSTTTVKDPISNVVVFEIFSFLILYQLFSTIEVSTIIVESSWVEVTEWIHVTIECNNGTFFILLAADSVTTELFW